MVDVRAQNFHHLSTQIFAKPVLPRLPVVLDYVPAKLTFFLTLNNVVSEFRLQDKERELHMNFEKLQAFLSAALDLNKHFGLAFATFLYEQPTDFGVPMAYVHEAVSMLGVERKFRKDANETLD